MRLIDAVLSHITHSLIPRHQKSCVGSRTGIGFYSITEGDDAWEEKRIWTSKAPES
jgi:hypothetical protein